MANAIKFLKGHMQHMRDHFNDKTDAEARPPPFYPTTLT
jgi:hypothetical protein